MGINQNRACYENYYVIESFKLNLAEHKTVLANVEKLLSVSEQK